MLKTMFLNKNINKQKVIKMREIINLAKNEMNLRCLEEEIKKYEQPGGFFDTYWTQSIEDAMYIKNSTYRLLGLKTDDHTWVKGSGGVGWSSKLVLLYAKIDSKELKKLETLEIETRHRHNPALDKKHLWGFNKIGLEFIGENKVKAYWTNRSGEKGLEYELSLE